MLEKIGLLRIRRAIMTQLRRRSLLLLLRPKGKPFLATDNGGTATRIDDDDATNPEDADYNKIVEAKGHQERNLSVQ